MRVLLAEDDVNLGEALRDWIKKEGYTIDWLQDGLLADQVLRTEQFDIVILDLGLPKLSGLRLLENLRLRGSRTPVLILTAREAIEDRVKGLDMGADDYMTKPFDLHEISARLRALQRRSVDRAVPTITYIHHGNEILIDTVAHEITFKGTQLGLPRREFSLLQKLLENKGKAMSRDQLTQSLYNWDEDVDSNALEVHIHNLRKKFGPDLIRTIRGIGYMIDKEKEAT